MSYQLIRQLQEKAFPVQHCCRVLSVSRSGYYEAQRRSAKPVLRTACVYLKAAFMASHQSYGLMRWVQRFVPEFEKRWNRYARRGGQQSWHVDETYVKFCGEWV